jgi:hypothetical protein
VQETRIASFAYDDASAQRLFEELGDVAGKPSVPDGEDSGY